MFRYWWLYANNFWYIQQDTIPFAVKTSALRSWRWTKDCPKHVELILDINKSLLHLVGSSILLYLHWWCTIKHKSSQQWFIICHKIQVLRTKGCDIRPPPTSHAPSFLLSWWEMVILQLNMKQTPIHSIIRSLFTVHSAMVYVIIRDTLPLF